MLRGAGGVVMLTKHLFQEVNGCKGVRCPAVRGSLTDSYASQLTHSRTQQSTSHTMTHWHTHLAKRAAQAEEDDVPGCVWVE